MMPFGPFPFEFGERAWRSNPFPVVANVQQISAAGTGKVCFGDAELGSTIGIDTALKGKISACLGRRNGPTSYGYLSPIERTVARP
jgi:hypothetical protein